MEYFGSVATGYEDAVETAFLAFTTWRKREKIPCSQKRFKVNSLIRPTTYGFYR